MNEKVFHDDRVNGLIFDFFVAGAVSSSLESTALVRENQMDRKIFTVKICMTKFFPVQRNSLQSLDVNRMLASLCAILFYWDVCFDKNVLSKVYNKDYRITKNGFRATWDEREGLASSSSSDGDALDRSSCRKRQASVFMVSLQLRRADVEAWFFCDVR